MGFRIQNNITAINAHKNLGISDTNMSKSLEKLSSGFRINRAADDAAGLSVSQSFRADIASYKVASRNTSEANSMLQVAEGAMDQIGNMLTRLKELATQSASANVSDTDRTKINTEGDKLIAEMDRLVSTTKYGSTSLIDGSFGVGVTSGAGNTLTAASGYAGASGMQTSTNYRFTVATSGAGQLNITVTATVGGTRMTETLYDVATVTGSNTKDVRFAALGLSLTINSNFTSTNASGDVLLSKESGNASYQVGAKNTADDRIDVAIASVKATGTGGLGLSTGQLSSASSAQSFMTTLDTAIGSLATERGKIGAAQNRLSYAAANLATTIENTTAAESVIRDADMAAEMTTLSKNQILLQAGTAMLAQANQAPQQLLSLFQ